MKLVRTLFRRGKFLGSWEEEELRKTLEAHAPDWLNDSCKCGEDVRPGDWDAFLNHIQSACLLTGRRMGSRFWE